MWNTIMNPYLGPLRRDPGEGIGRSFSTEFRGHYDTSKKIHAQFLQDFIMNLKTSGSKQYGSLRPNIL